MSGHRLVSVRRRVRDVAAEEYRRDWAAVRKAVEGAGGRAWAFRMRNDPRERIEFIEYESGSDPRAGADVAQALERMDHHHPGRTEEWEECG